jgi:hypothetical protein
MSPNSLFNNIFAIFKSIKLNGATKVSATDDLVELDVFDSYNDNEHLNAIFTDDFSNIIHPANNLVEIYNTFNIYGFEYYSTRDLRKIVTQNPDFDVNFQSKKNKRTILVSAMFWKAPAFAREIIEHPTMHIDTLEKALTYQSWLTGKTKNQIVRMIKNKIKKIKTETKSNK